MAKFPGPEGSTLPIRTPDRQKAGSTNWRSQFDRPQADPKGEARSAE
jgi:hypothetical protein